MISFIFPLNEPTIHNIVEIHFYMTIVTFSTYCKIKTKPRHLFSMHMPSFLGDRGKDPVILQNGHFMHPRPPPSIWWVIQKMFGVGKKTRVPELWFLTNRPRKRQFKTLK